MKEEEEEGKTMESGAYCCAQNHCPSKIPTSYSEDYVTDGATVASKLILKEVSHPA